MREDRVKQGYEALLVAIDGGKGRRNEGKRGGIGGGVCTVMRPPSPIAPGTIPARPARPAKFGRPATPGRAPGRAREGTA